MINFPSANHAYTVAVLVFYDNFLSIMKVEGEMRIQFATCRLTNILILIVQSPVSNCNCKTQL